MTKLDKLIERRRYELTAARCDLAHLEERLAYEHQLHTLKLRDLIEEYRRCVTASDGWEWRAISEVIHHRLSRLERKDHTKLK